MSTTFYFIRHAETVMNSKKMSGSSLDVLSERGERQAQQLGEWLRVSGIEKVIVSPYIRTQQTAAVAAGAHHEIVSSPLFAEIKAPSELAGIPHGEGAEIRALRTQYWGMEGMHVSDEENFFDVLPRAVSALSFLTNLEEEKVAVVTHGAFLTVVLAVMVYGKKVTPEIATAIFNSFPMSHTGISAIQLDNAGKWKVLCWNDTHHLEDVQ
jgi:probable phosphoglycerate mutase